MSPVHRASLLDQIQGPCHEAGPIKGLIIAMGLAECIGKRPIRYGGTAICIFRYFFRQMKGVHLFEGSFKTGFRFWMGRIKTILGIAIILGKVFEFCHRNGSTIGIEASFFHKTEALITLAGVTVDPRARQVWKDGEEIALTPKEYDLLLLFLRNPNAALYRDTIYEKVWGGELAYGSKTVDLHVQRLRKKVGWEETLRAVHKVGYRLEAEP